MLKNYTKGEGVDASIRAKYAKFSIANLGYAST